ncbi:MAG TPA: hypothetical protein VEX15_13465 [Nocardioidaceae bacterium]|nr:hypothetical protein [Nocardioidaceae bacterium]
MDPQGPPADDADPAASTAVPEPERPDPRLEDDDPTSCRPSPWEPL